MVNAEIKDCFAVWGTLLKTHNDPLHPLRNHQFKQLPFLHFFSININRWKAVCVCPAVRAVYEGWKADELELLPGKQWWTIRGPWVFVFSFLNPDLVQDFGSKGPVQSRLKISKEWDVRTELNQRTHYLIIALLYIFLL